MSTTRRFFIEPDRLTTGLVTLSEEESRHASVLRLHSGDAVELLSGDGRVGQGVVDLCSRKKVTIQINGIQTAPPSSPLITVATAIPKGKRYQTMVEKLTELGAAVIQPVLFERSVVEGKGDLERVRRWSHEACKQSRRAWATDIREPLAFTQLLDGISGTGLLADPDGEPIAHASNCLHCPEFTLIVGPEGGVTDGERETALSAGATPVAFGPHIMRIETAAMAGCAILMAGGGV